MRRIDNPVSNVQDDWIRRSRNEICKEGKITPLSSVDRNGIPLAYFHCRSSCYKKG